MGTTMTPTTAIDAARWLPLLVWFSPAFPVGAFAYSHGLEWAVEAGEVHDAATVGSWIADLLALGAARNDGILLAVAYRAVAAGDAEALREVAELALALPSSRERHLETTAQGRAFLAAAQAAWPTPAFDLLRTAWDGEVAYPVAVGIAAAGQELALGQTLAGFLLAWVANLTSAAVRLGPIGQTDGQRIIAALLPAVRDQAAVAAASALLDLGGAVFRSDLAAIQHETQYSRLFRS
jgi:urease accessory protein